MTRTPLRKRHVWTQTFFFLKRKICIFQEYTQLSTEPEKSYHKSKQVFLCIKANDTLFSIFWSAKIKWVKADSSSRSWEFIPVYVEQECWTFIISCKIMRTGVQFRLRISLNTSSHLSCYLSRLERCTGIANFRVRTPTSLNFSGFPAFNFATASVAFLITS